eukprot:CAMPEP_0184650036 /NCGR_PEP_ID=MMETSP0308-20130426/7521_1 /TAXON_ID=38269 /ORGANISM="Gloeochaete witrockiana, Strain SAG 46.84" /LENGTH=667 /DNA_ID=CAMNT_0027083263 /DNA_START=20 /DNA_END=2020 /DNA_ORIENTATION=+
MMGSADVSDKKGKKRAAENGDDANPKKASAVSSKDGADRPVKVSARDAEMDRKNRAADKASGSRSLDGRNEPCCMCDQNIDYKDCANQDRCSACGFPAHADCIPKGKESWECRTCSSVKVATQASAALPPVASATKPAPVSSNSSLSSSVSSSSVNKPPPVTSFADKEKDALQCAICMDLCNIPVMTPCAHHFCKKCLEKNFAMRGKACPNCRKDCSLMKTPWRVDFKIADEIRRFRARNAPKATVSASTSAPTAPKVRIPCDPSRKKAGNSNAGKRPEFTVDIPTHHLGPIPDVAVGTNWKHRTFCSEAAIHRPPVSGIHGAEKVAAFSLALSGGYEDDIDEGDWFLYTGSGGRDLSGNKRTAKQSSDQEFTRENKALVESCIRGLPVRVVRGYKDKTHGYAPETGYRYDGIYMVEDYWRDKGESGFKVCRYRLVRMDNEQPPWDTSLDWKPTKPALKEEKPRGDKAPVGGVAGEYRSQAPHPYGRWGWQEDNECFGWIIPSTFNPRTTKHVSAKKSLVQMKSLISDKERKAQTQRHTCCLPKCKSIMKDPISVPCGHHFCKECFITATAGAAEREREFSGRSLRKAKVTKQCPAGRCNGDVSEMAADPAVNVTLKNLIEIFHDKCAKQDEEDKLFKEMMDKAKAEAATKQDKDKDEDKADGNEEE